MSETERGGDGGGDPTGPRIWDSQRVETLGAALVTAANTARIGLAIVRIEVPEPRVVYMSDVGIEILGHPKDQIVGGLARGFLTPEEQALRQPAPQPVPAQHRASRTIETAVVRGDGRHVPVEVTLAPITLDGESIIVIFFRDITQRRAALESVRRSQERFRLLFELAPDAVWVNDGARLVYVNPGAVKMLGYDTVDEVLAIDPRRIVHPDDHEAMTSRTREMMRTGQALPSYEYRTCRKDGTVLVTEVQSMPIEWDGHKALLGVARDVTARKEMEARLARSERLAALGTLLAGIVHELNNPLAYTLLGIDQALAQLERIPFSPELGALGELLREVRGGTQRVASIVGQLRSTSQPDATDRDAIDLREVIHTALRVAGNEIRHRARLITELAEVPRISGSASRLEQVLLNLLVNAAQSFVAAGADNEIRLRLQAGAGDIVVVEVSDNGAGIPAEVLPRIFDPFFTTKAVGVGMGLGLSICHNIVTAHGGTLDVHSTPGQGTRFRLTLPVRSGRSAAGPAADTAAPTAASPRRRRVLIVDDEAPLAAMLGRMLEDDFELEIASNAQSALEVLRGGPAKFDIVLCDLMMPQMNGMDFFRAVSELLPDLSERFIFMTGGAFTPWAAEFLASSRRPCLEKPFDYRTLRAMLEKF
jgi:PAS domain S-box-containing protein